MITNNIEHAAAIENLSALMDGNDTPACVALASEIAVYEGANNFAALSAESEVSRLAQVSSAEVYAEEPALAPAPCSPALARAAAAVSGSYAGKGPNAAKLVRHNLRQPLASRLSRLALASRVEVARVRGAMVGLWAEIHAECAPARAALRAQMDAVEAL